MLCIQPFAFFLVALGWKPRFQGFPVGIQGLYKENKKLKTQSQHLFPRKEPCSVDTWPTSSTKRINDKKEQHPPKNIIFGCNLLQRTSIPKNILSVCNQQRTSTEEHHLWLQFVTTYIYTEEHPVCLQSTTNENSPPHPKPPLLQCASSTEEHVCLQAKNASSTRSIIQKSLFDGKKDKKRSSHPSAQQRSWLLRLSHPTPHHRGRGQLPVTSSN